MSGDPGMYPDNFMVAGHTVFGASSVFEIRVHRVLTY
jgi:hypothetical protein